ncbi:MULTISPECIES: GNAT family N-acetyltransferase [Thiorhodovibrio]|uniref:GNAT family N-acetyltransferase n=1 Tax=Thiorhodovibrio TaxID=61593 RepID=UPI0019116711|nr:MULTISPECIES: GNAT family N-acyltransferase [Thiorhodovibrio]MBK5968969.1 hemolysin [Thiorhodovibrio winogradskyi]WPL10315.1 N-acyl amino acid synthase, PEP-CTERM/exosortase system-associated [Thiorhodovibrio litoralis]
MGATAPVSSNARAERLRVEFADSDTAVREALALRYRIFGLELGAKLKSDAERLDYDDFDHHCQHLLVRETETGQVVACTRILAQTAARRLGRFYSEGEFDLGPIRRLDGCLAELGRTCVAREYRQGSAIAVLWSGVARYIQMHQANFLFGCASIPLGAGDAQAAAIMNRLRRQAMAPAHLRVSPRQPLRVEGRGEPKLDAPLPPLVKAYVRLGARACGEPCRDPDFQVADVLMLLDVRELNPSYSRHFIRRSHGNLASV